MKGQKLRVLDHFEKYGSITSKEAFENYGITRLASVINVLRNLGYDIITLTIEGKNRYDETTRYGKYVYKGKIENGN